MRPSFRKSLEGYQRVAKDLAAPVQDEAGRQNLETVRDWHLQKSAKDLSTNRNAEEQIFSIQQKKEQLMRRLKAELQAIDRRDSSPEDGSGAIAVTYESNSESFLVRFQGKEYRLTPGQIISDLTWGKSYALDPQATPMLFRKRYAFERIKSQIAELTDVQIAQSEDVRTRDQSTGAGYFRENIPNKTSEATGFVAERMTYALLKQVMLDERTGIRVQPGDMYQDMENKIDILLMLPHWMRGITVATTGGTDVEKMERHGLQLFATKLNATEESSEKVQKKQKQINRVLGRRSEDRECDDLKLVILNEKEIRKTYDQWKRMGQPPGGPESFLSHDAERRILVESLKSLLPPDALEKLLKRLGLGDDATPEATGKKVVGTSVVSTPESGARRVPESKSGKSQFQNLLQNAELFEEPIKLVSMSSTKDIAPFRKDAQFVAESLEMWNAQAAAYRQEALKSNLSQEASELEKRIKRYKKVIEHIRRRFP